MKDLITKIVAWSIFSAAILFAMCVIGGLYYLSHIRFCM